jgi:hypothetical protein
MNRKEKIIKIKEIIIKWGKTTSCELELEFLPCISSIGKNNHNVETLIEEYNLLGVLAITYHNDIEIDEDNILYEDLNDYNLNEVLEIMENYDIDIQKTMDRCQNENF